MYGRVFIEERAGNPDALGEEWDGRFVVHRHRDAEGPHVDLRLEQDGFLAGWRIAGEFESGAWAEEKAAHPVHWLDRDGDAVREDAGVYRWIERGPLRRVVCLKGEHGVRWLRVEAHEGLPAGVACAVRCALDEAELGPESALSLVKDGLVARKRATARLLGLGRELDGDAFDVEAWRRALAGLSLEEVQSHLRAYEVRFDAKYPPLPVSRPERLDAGASVRGDALAIARESM